nr:Asp-tRNA(Asn)/Glu-tRNA(Gln) amidotransferase GatCAB subunit C [Lachnospiraceae bacterium]
DALTDMAKGSGAKGLAYMALLPDGTVKSSFSKFLTEEEIAAISKKMAGEPGDLLLFVSDKKKLVWNVLGQLRCEIAKQLELIDPDRYDLLWVVDFPLLEWSDEEERYKATHHPFTMPYLEDWAMVDEKPGEVRAKAYDIVINGYEAGGGSVRIHMDDVQEKMFEVLGITKEQAYDRFGFLLDAFKYGVPPHAGLAFGLDRLVMLLTKTDNIREVIAFPKVKDASDLMNNAPDYVDDAQLDELYIKTEVPEE